MQYRALGNSGLHLSVIGLGSWLTFGNTVENDATRECVRAAFEAGVTFFDTASTYSKGRAEEALIYGRAGHDVFPNPWEQRLTALVFHNPGTYFSATLAHTENDNPTACWASAFSR